MKRYTQTTNKRQLSLVYTMEKALLLPPALSYAGGPDACRLLGCQTGLPSCEPFTKTSAKSPPARQAPYQRCYFDLPSRLLLHDMNRALRLGPGVAIHPDLPASTPATRCCTLHTTPLFIHSHRMAIEESNGCHSTISTMTGQLIFTVRHQASARQ